MVATSPKAKGKKPEDTKLSGKLRIIAGKWRGRKLPVANVEGLRPTGDRIRETLFNWLQAEIHGARCLDLFAGSGALGFEALSRGAAAVDFVEKHPGVAKQLCENCALLGANGTVHELEATTFLNRANSEAYNLVFVDPPFAANAWETCLAMLDKKPLLASDALIYIESPADIQPLVPAKWRELKRKTSGRVQFALYQKPA